MKVLSVTTISHHNKVSLLVHSIKTVGLLLDIGNDFAYRGGGGGALKELNC